MRLVSEQTGVDYNTLMDWKRQEWWGEMVSSLRRQAKTKTSNTLTKVIEQSLDIIQERLEHGDPFFNLKTGKIEYKPVALKDAASIVANLMQRQLQLEEFVEKTQRNEDTVQDTLKLLAKEFIKWNKGNKPTEYIEVTDALEGKTLGHYEQEKGRDNALHDKRETRLQEGSGEIYLTSGSNKEASGTEQSSKNYDESWESS